jgi:hypothetical protein
MECDKELETFNFQVFFERRRRNRENGIKRKADRMLDEERMDKIIAELSEEMDTRKRQWYDLARTYEQFRREDTVEEKKGEYRCTIKQTEHMMMELDNFLFGNSNMNLA